MPVAGAVVFVKLTTSGAQPDAGLAVKPAVSAWAEKPVANTDSSANRSLQYFILYIIIRRRVKTCPNDK